MNVLYSAIKKNVANDNGSVSFKCPNCMGYVITRSRNERTTVTKYTCPQCGFVGPN